MNPPANTPEGSQFGKASAYTDQHDPSLLFLLPPSPIHI